MHVGENTAIQKEIDKVIPKTMEKSSIDPEKSENNTEINTGTTTVTAANSNRKPKVDL